MLLGKTINPSSTPTSESDRKIRPDEVKITFHAAGDCEPKGIMAVGAGVREVLFLLTKCLGQQDKIVLMDEPATNLHPTRIRILMNNILSPDNSGDKPTQVVIITHSPILADIELLSSVNEIVRVDRTTDSRITQPSGKDRKWIVDNISTFHLLKSSVLFAKGVILVEGPSDRIFLEAVLRHSEKFDMVRGDLVVLDVGGYKSFPKFRKFLEIFGILFFILADGKAPGKFEEDEVMNINPASMSSTDKKEWEYRIVFVFKKDLEDYLASLDGELYRKISTTCNSKPETAYRFVTHTT